MLQESILQYFQPSLSYQLSLRPFSVYFLSGRFTQVLLYVFSIALKVNHPRLIITNQMEEFINKHRGSYLSHHVLLNLLNRFGKRDNIEPWQAFYHFFAASLINLKIQEHECRFYLSHDIRIA